MNKKSTFAMVVLLLLCALVAGAHADIKYSQKTTMGDGDMPLMQSTRYVADGKERNDTAIKIGGYDSTESEIYLCASKENYRIDRALKIYTVEENAINRAGIPTTPPMPGRSARKSKTGEGKVSVNIKITNLPDEKIAGQDTKHFMAELQMKTSGCVGNSDSTIKMEMWVANIKDAQACKTSDVNYAAILGQQFDGNCKVTYEATGDVAAFTGAWSGVVMRQKTFHNDKAMMVQEVTSLSQAKLDADIFAIPSDFTKVSAKEYEDRRQKAMMKAIMGGAGGFSLPF